MKISDLQIDHQLDQLLELHPKRIDLSLDRIKKLLSKLDSPQNKIENIIAIMKNKYTSSIPFSVNGFGI